MYRGLDLRKLSYELSWRQLVFLYLSQELDEKNTEEHIFRDPGASLVAGLTLAKYSIQELLLANRSSRRQEI